MRRYWVFVSVVICYKAESLVHSVSYNSSWRKNEYIIPSQPTGLEGSDLSLAEGNGWLGCDGIDGFLLNGKAKWLMNVRGNSNKMSLNLRNAHLSVKSLLSLGRNAFEVGNKGVTLGLGGVKLENVKNKKGRIIFVGWQHTRIDNNKTNKAQASSFWAPVKRRKLR